VSLTHRPQDSGLKQGGSRAAATVVEGRKVDASSTTVIVGRRLIHARRLLSNLRVL
jgi:hypothetical protein